MVNIALFPGSFDPFTAGHQNIVERGLRLFDRIIVAVGENSQKKGLLSIEARKALISDTFKNNPNIEVIAYSGLTVDLCNKLEVPFILRGVRSSVDFEYERSIDNVNQMLRPGVESVILMTDPHYAVISSSLVREMLVHGADTSPFMPHGIVLSDYLK